MQQLLLVFRLLRRCLLRMLVCARVGVAVVLSLHVRACAHSYDSCDACGLPQLPRLKGGAMQASCRIHGGWTARAQVMAVACGRATRGAWCSCCCGVGGTRHTSFSNVCRFSSCCIVQRGWQVMGGRSLSTQLQHNNAWQIKI
jgi:hypothetical protein